MTSSATPTPTATFGQQPSLMLRMSLALVVIALGVGAATAVWCYRNALASARTLQDDILIQVASIAATSRDTSTDVRTGQTPPADAATDIDIVVLPSVGVPTTTPDGLSELTIQGRAVRAVVVRRPDASRILVSQPLAVRDEIARQAAGSALLPFVFLVPLLLGSIVLVIRHYLRPVDTLASHVRGRHPDDLTPVDSTATPRELVGFLDALNGQVERVRAATDHERLFLSQAAHELRTPLTAMSLQLERASRAQDPTAVRERLGELRHGLRRTRHVVEQLLELASARSRPAQIGTVPADTPLDEIVRDVVAELLPVADAHHVEIEVRSHGPADHPVPGPATAAVVRNLVDNAIKYGAQPGLVIVTTESAPAGVIICVEDGGSGISDSATAVQAFHREARPDRPGAWGSGLGLSIVTELLTGLGGSLELQGSRAFPSGTRATATIPATPRPTHATEDDRALR